MQELVQFTWVFSRSFSMPCASFSILAGPRTVNLALVWDPYMLYSSTSWIERAEVKQKDRCANLKTLISSYVAIKIFHCVLQKVQFCCAALTLRHINNSQSIANSDKCFQIHVKTCESIGCLSPISKIFQKCREILILWCYIFLGILIVLLYI